MRWSVSIGCLLMAVATFVWGQDAGSDATPIDIVKETLEIMEKLTTQLAAIKDEETAKASRADLKKSAARWIQMRKRAEKMKPPSSKEEKDRLEKEFKGKSIAATKKLFSEIARVKDVPGGLDALKEIRALMEKKKSK